MAISYNDEIFVSLIVWLFDSSDFVKIFFFSIQHHLQKVKEEEEKEGKVEGWGWGEGNMEEICGLFT